MKKIHMKRRDFLKSSAAAALLLGAAGRGRAEETAFSTELKKALQYTMLPKELSDADKFKLALDCGFEGIEVDRIESVDEAQKLGELAREIGTPIHSLVFGGWDMPFSDPNPKVIQCALDAMSTQLRVANALQADTILLVPVVVNKKATTEQAWERSRKHIPELIPLAEEMNIVIALEEVWNGFLLDSASEFARYVDEFNSPWIQAYFDVGNVLKYGDPVEWIRTLGKRIRKIHLKDFRKAGEKWTNLRDGDVDWPAVRKAIDEVGYNGYLTTELGGGDAAYLKDLGERCDLIIAGK
ncbi:MAG TPA: sugar phosphate isomerase/epimerase family protein [Candidatus Hydrogenedentes bacterium]|nr:sugar phosphate isomerase/epimerase family protein [Candidatus Hydrogenedentota bacterium]